MKALITAIYQEKNHFVCRQTGDELLLIPLKDNVADFNQYLTFNEVGAFIWENLNEGDDEASLVAKICAEFEANKEEVLDDLRLFLEKLRNYLDIQ